MPKISKETVPTVGDFPQAESRTGDIDGYTVDFVTIRETHDLTQMLAGLPGGKCACPHWGYMLKGRVTVQYGDREEFFEAGDAFYMPPGHVPAAEAGSEFVQISPAKEMAVTMAAITKSMPPPQGG
jgi:hypothetical protein